MSRYAGIIFKILATLCGTLMLACVKGLDGAVPTGQIIFFRSVLALLPLVIWLGWQGNVLILVRTRNLSGHLVRGVSGVGGMFFSYLALAYIPLVDATALAYTAPLFTVILAAVLLGEDVRIYRWSAVIVGFFGVIVMLSPYLNIERPTAAGSSAIVGGLCALIAAFCAAVSSVQIRHLNETEQPGAIVLYFSLLTTLVGLGSAMFGWIMPTNTQFLLLIGCGVFGGLTQIFVTLGLRKAHASLLAPFEYTTMIWATGIGYIFFGQSPGLATLVGVMIVSGTGIFTLLREQNHNQSESPARAGKIRES